MACVKLRLRPAAIAILERENLKWRSGLLGTGLLHWNKAFLYRMYFLQNLLMLKAISMLFYKMEPYSPFYKRPAPDNKQRSGHCVSTTNITKLRSNVLIRGGRSFRVPKRGDLSFSSNSRAYYFNITHKNKLFLLKICYNLFNSPTFFSQSYLTFMTKHLLRRIYRPNTLIFFQSRFSVIFFSYCLLEISLQHNLS